MTDINITFVNHRYNTGIWKTPYQLDTDPLVCMINSERFYCNPTNLPQLQILILNASIVIGKNRL
jgi:hypothetical protein